MTDTSQAAAAPVDAEDTVAESRTLSIPVLCVAAFLVGIVAALGAVVFRYMIAMVHNGFILGTFSFVHDANQFDPISPFGAFVILAPVVGGLIVVWLVQTFAPEAKGHGVPEVMYAIYHNKGNVRGIVAVIKSIASAISIGSGASVGREGPIIQIGASFGSTLARIFHLARWQRITLLASGAGAGIAATFNTPLGGVLFAVELLLPEVSNRTFLPVVVATTTATSIARFVFGLAPAFQVPPASLPHGFAFEPIQFLWFAVLGVVAGIASWAFIAVLAWCEDFFPTLPGNAYTQNMVGMLFIGLLFYAFQVTTGHLHTAGVGYSTIQWVLDGGQSGFLLLGALFVGKLVATSVSLGSGSSGGVFSPSLFIGVTLGAAIGALGTILFPWAQFSVIAFAIVGMGAVVGGATGASMTAIVMIFEMTRDYDVMVPLVLTVAISVGVRRALVAENIYTIKLRHRGRPIPTIRHTNMYLVRQASEVMSQDFLVLPVETLLVEALRELGKHDKNHIIVSDGQRIAGYARLGAGYTPDRFSEETLRSVIRDDYVIAPETSILNTIITRMNQRARSMAIVVSRDANRVPRPDDVIGVIDSPEIASEVIANHYA